MSYYHPYDTKNKYIFDWRSYDHTDYDDISNILNEELKTNKKLREQLKDYIIKNEKFDNENVKIANVWFSDIISEDKAYEITQNIKKELKEVE